MPLLRQTTPLGRVTRGPVFPADISACNSTIKLVRVNAKYDTVIPLQMALCRQLGEFFFMQGRPYFYPKGTVTYCIVEYQYRYSYLRPVDDFIRKNSWFENSTRSVHAEEMVLRQIEMTELDENW
jgi:hypothetical protein